MAIQFEIQSPIAASPTEFWRSMTMTSVNREMAPLLRMTAPAEWKDRTIESWSIDELLFKSTILLFGVLPVDVHFILFTWIEPGRGFREGSWSWINSLWAHERTTREIDGGCVVIDSVTYQSRIPPLGRLLLPVYRMVFRHRHRRLKAIYGEASCQAQRP